MDNTIKKTADVLAEEWCQAVELLVQQNLKQLPYDQTIVCTVVDNSQKEDNIYLVQNGDTKFNAYSDGETYYRINDQVRVSILNGDFSEKKFIVGKYAAAAGEALPYVFPAETVLQMHNNITPQDNVSLPLLWSASFSADTYADKNIYDTLFIKAKFTTIVDSIEPYKLKIVLHSGNGNTEIYFEHTELIGNPFTFYLPSTQQKAFNIVDYTGLNGIDIYLEGAQPPQVKIEEVYIGTQLAYQDNKTFKIFTPDSKTYRIEKENNTDNLKRELGLQWINKTDLNEYIGFSDGIYENGYDEIAYLQQKEYNEALVALKSDTMPKSFDGLKAYYDYQQARTFFPALEKKLDDFANYVNQLRFSNYAELLRGFTMTDGSQVDTISLDVIWENLNGTITDIKNYNSTELPKVMDVLMAAVRAVELGGTGIWGIEEPSIEYQNMQTNLFAQLVLGIDKLSGTEEIAGYDRLSFPEYAEYLTDYKNAREVILTYKKDIDKSFADILPYIQNVKSHLQVAYTSANPPIEEYVLLNAADFANRYSLYWYHYQENYVREEDTGEKEYFLPNGWKRLEQYDNVGLPGPQRAAAADNNIYLQASTLQPVLTGDECVLLDDHQQKMIFKAVLIYNHEIFESNDLTFQNLDSLQIAYIEDMNGSLIIQHGDNSYESYQSYGETGYLLNHLDSVTPRTLYVDYNGVFGGNEYLNGAVIRWYVPSGPTMLVLKTTTENGITTIDGTNLTKTISSISGYDCYINTLTDASIIERSLIYYIQPFYMANMTNNTIKCEVVKNSLLYEAELNFEFMSYGISGTDYRLMIKPLGWRYATTTTEGLNLELTLLDRNNERVPIENLVIELESTNGANASQMQYQDSIISVPANYYGILKIIINGMAVSTDKGNRYVDLTTYYSVPWASDEAYSAVGATSIIYNSLGTDPKYYNSNYQLYENETPVTATWNLENILNNYGMPKLDNKNILQPACLYVPIEPDDNGNKQYPTIEAVIGGSPVWKQDIYIGQNQYGIPALNNWDGSMLIDENNNLILSAMVGAGRKDNSNRFSGVLMGAVPLDSESKKSIEGLFGFHQGAQSFGFKVDGTAFLGKSGGGRILFDGNYGFIASQNWFTGVPLLDDNNQPVLDENGQPIYQAGSIEYHDENTYTINPSNAGMLIDLQNGHIDAYNFKLTSAGIQLNSNPENNQDYILVGNKDGAYISCSRINETDLAVDMKVDSFALTGNQALGGENLLRDSAPETINSNIWGEDIATSSIITTDDNKENVFSIAENDELYQMVVVNPNEFYTLSGWLAANTQTTITYQIVKPVSPNMVLASGQLNPSEDKWFYFSLTAAATETNEIAVVFFADDEFSLWHPKLEQGKMATAWSAHALDSKLNQNNVFNALTNNGKTKGIWLNNNELFINASVLGTSLLRSNNFNGTVSKIGAMPLKNEQGRYILYNRQNDIMAYGIYKLLDVSTLRSAQWTLYDKSGVEILEAYAPDEGDTDLNLPTPPTDYEYCITVPTYDIYWSDNSIPEGICWDLNSGKLLAANFTLEAGKEESDDFLYLSNTNYGDSQNRLIIGQNFSVSSTGSMYASEGTIGGITITDTGLAAGGILYERNGIFSGTLNFSGGTKLTGIADADVTYQNGVTKVRNYSEQIDNDYWTNEIYKFDTEVKVYVSGFGRSTELFVVKQTIVDNDFPTGTGTTDTVGFDTVYHAKLRNSSLSNYCITVPSDCYLIVNRNPISTSTPTVSSNPTSFKIGADGLIECSEAKIGGSINATSITASQSCNIAQWEITPTSITLDGGAFALQTGDTLDSAWLQVAYAATGYACRIKPLSVTFLGAGVPIITLTCDNTNKTIRLSNGTKTWAFDFDNGYFDEV